MEGSYGTGYVPLFTAALMTHEECTSAVALLIVNHDFATGEVRAH